jgi:hypothetical protein
MFEIPNHIQQVAEAERVLRELAACKDALLISVQACQDLFNELDTAIKPERELRAELHETKQTIKKIKASNDPTTTPTTKATTTPSTNQ